HKGFVQTDNIVKGIESVLEPEKNSIDLIIEYMDSKAIEFGTQYKEKLYDLYNYKYCNRKFDLIISSDDNAFDFLREYHDDLFPDTPIVFCGVNNFDAPNLIDHNVFTGILEVQSIRETIDLALVLHPKTGKIVFIVDDTPTGLYFWNMAQKLFKYYEDIQMIHFDSSLSMAQIENKVSKLSDDTILYFGTFHRDKDGIYYSFDETISRLSKASAQPMYGNSVQVLPYGIVGGKLFGGFYHGQITAELAQRILKEEKVQDIPVLTEPQTQYMFNYEQMQRFGINTSNLPEGSIIINKPFSFYEENKILIWSVIAFVALQMLIIISLIINITKRKQAETQIKHLNLVLRAIRNVNQLIVKEKNSEVLIKKVCEILIADRGYNNAWLVLLGKQRKYINSAEAGLGKNFIPMKKMLEEGKLTICGNDTIEKNDLVIIKDPKKECVDCPLSANYSGRFGCTICIKHDDNIYGLLSVSASGHYINDKEEQ
ncbi:MAG: hypothetical protein K8R49_09450, partial [Candidatus Cloacimonetes bacterium]|nr:hypothetical protein [Candidatus Cloacimonadota bacterium]